MVFRFSGQYVDEFVRDGGTVFRQILPTSLITDLRRACATAVAHVRADGNAQLQRLNPATVPGLDQKPFDDFRELPELVDAITRVLSAEHRIESPSVLIQPDDMPWSTYWHRDWRDNVPGLDIPAWEKIQTHLDYFNQFNCALYEDGSTWLVPGSHARTDTQAEIDRFPSRPVPQPDLTGLTSEEAERVGLEYCQSMPGAVRLNLDAGDFALYRSIQWHIGNYVPYRRRATLHGQLMTSAYQDWWDKSPIEAYRRQKARAAA